VADYPTRYDEHQNGDADGAERAQRLAKEDLDLDPGQFPESAQYHDQA
jgi:hypothetical protein